MPAKSQAQRGLIFGKRKEYGSKSKTPDKWKWIWDKDYENKGELPKKVDEADRGFEETHKGEAYLDIVADYLRDEYSLTHFKAEVLLDIYNEMIYDCFLEDESAEYCAEKIMKMEGKTNETVQNVVMEKNPMEESFRAKTVSESINDKDYI